MTSPSDLEALSVNVGHSNPTTFCIVYTPPSSTEEHLLSLFNYLRSVSDLRNNKLILIGDFNFPTINWNLLQYDTSISNSFCDLVFYLNLVQLVDQPTHSCGNILDLVLTNIEDSIAFLSIHPVDFTPIKSDHFPVTFSLNANLSLVPPKAPPF